jgi:flagellar hook-length control protein FliK
MANESISAHVVVISQSSGKLPETKANTQPNAESGADFANILAAQIQGDAPAAEIAAAASADPAALDSSEKPANALDITDLSADPEAAQQLAEGQNTVPIAYLQGVQVEVHVQVQACCGDQHGALALEANDLAAKSLSATPAAPVLETKTDLEKAAKEFADPAKVAASDKSLPIESLREIKTEAVNTTVPAANLAQANRATPLPAHSAPVSLPAVEVPVGHAGWDAAFSQRVAWAASNNQQVAQLQLNPPNLGPVEIRITLNSDQANAAFTSPHAAVREAIEAALPRLRDMLADNGLSLGNVNVSSQSFQQQQQQQHANGHGGGQRHDPFQELQRIAASGNGAGSAVQAGIASVLANKGLVDIFA